jgi:hypothetical protein
MEVGMDLSLSMMDLSRPDPAAPVQALNSLGHGRHVSAPAAPQGRRGSGFAEAAVSLTQVGLVGQAMIDRATLPDLPGAAPGEPRRAERVLEPWGVPMLPSEAARLAREAAEAERRAALKWESGSGGQPMAEEDGGPLAVPAPEADPAPGTDVRGLPDPGRPLTTEGRGGSVSAPIAASVTDATGAMEAAQGKAGAGALTWAAGTETAGQPSPARLPR